mgnify:CR=1 FL=1
MDLWKLLFSKKKVRAPGNLPRWMKTKIARKTEKFIDKAIPPLVLLLGIIILLEFLNGLEEYLFWINLFDYVVVSFFVVDLIFKWYHTRLIVPFVRNYWLDILAVFPFYLAFRTWQELVLVGQLSQEVGEAQKVAHEVVLLRETALLKEVELLKEARLLEEVKLIRGVKMSQRIVREVALLREEEEKTSSWYHQVKRSLRQWVARQKARWLIAHAKIHRHRLGVYE